MRYNAMSEEFEEVTLLDKPALFTPLRIDRNTVPYSYHLYEVRHDDDCQGDAVQMACNIYVNHWGSLIMREELVAPNGFLDIKPEDLNYSTGDCRSMKDFMTKYPPNDSKLKNIRDVASIVDAPDVSLTADEKAGDVLLKFYRALGWNSDDHLDPCKIRTTKAVYNHLYDTMYERCPDPVGVGMHMVNRGPGTDDYIPTNKVYLLEGWVTPAEAEEENGNHQQAV